MEKKIKKIIADIADIDIKEVKLESNLSADLDIESLDLVNLIVGIEEEFDIEIEDSEIKKLQTVEDIINLVKGLSD